MKVNTALIPVVHHKFQKLTKIKIEAIVVTRQYLVHTIVEPIHSSFHLESKIISSVFNFDCSLIFFCRYIYRTVLLGPTYFRLGWICYLGPSGFNYCVETL